jgi:hypothetical protein
MNGRLVAVLLALVVSACAGLPTPTVLENLPGPLKPVGNESLAMIVAAKGAQIYECRASKERAGVYEWAFVAPEAELFDASGRKVGRHYAGPRWESADGSAIAGTVKEHVDARRADAIPWLLLVAKSVGPQGAFSNVTSVRRVNTVGGVAPKTGCTESTAGTVVRVPYTADYYFSAQENDAWSLSRTPARRVAALGGYAGQ